MFLILFNPSAEQLPIGDRLLFAMTAIFTYFLQVQCSNGQIAYGRRRRAVASRADSNTLYEVALTTFIKVEYLDGQKDAGEDI